MSLLARSSAAAKNTPQSFDNLQAVRYGDWKLNLTWRFSEAERQNILQSTYRIAQFCDHVELYNLRTDPGETTNIADKNPEVVSRLTELADEEKNALGEYADKGPGIRETILIDAPAALIK